MARYTFGAGSGDTVVQAPTPVAPVLRPILNANAVGTFWSSQTAGTQYVDLLDAATGSAISGLSTDQTGAVRQFKGPDGVMAGWIDFGSGRRFIIAFDGVFTAGDAAVAGYIGTAGTSTRGALDARYRNVMAGGNRMVAFGDSTVLGNDTATSHQASWPTYAMLYTGGQIWVAKNAGIIGNTTQNLLDRFDTDVTPVKPNLVILSVGRNDMNNSVPLATYQANIGTLVSRIRGIGALPVLTTITPTNGSTAGTTSLWNKWIKAYAQANGLPLVDFYNAIVDPATGQYLATYNSGDGIHPSPAGYAVLGQALATALQPYLPPFTPPLVGSDVDAANLLTHGCFLGGAVNANGEPPGWYQEAPAQVTGTLVTGDSAIKGNWHKQTCVGTTTAEAAIYQNPPALTVGHTYLVTGLVESSLTAGGFTVEVDANGSAFYAAYNLAATVSKPGFFAFRFTANATAANLKLAIQSGSAGSVQFAQVGWFDETALGIDGLL